MESVLSPVWYYIAFAMRMGKNVKLTDIVACRCDISIVDQKERHIGYWQWTGVFIDHICCDFRKIDKILAVDWGVYRSCLQ